MRRRFAATFAAALLVLSITAGTALAGNAYGKVKHKGTAQAGDAVTAALQEKIVHRIEVTR